MKGPRRLLVASAAAVLLAGCEAPNVNIKQVTPSGGTANDLQLDVELEVTNDHSFDVKVQTITATVTVATKFPLEPITISPNRWIPANTTHTFHIVVGVPWRELPGIEVVVLARNGLDYDVSGVANVLVTSSLALGKKQSFHATGIVKRDELLKKMTKLPAPVLIPLPIPTSWPVGLPVGFPQ